MTTTYVDYLSLLRELGRTLSALTEVAQEKINAVRQDDLTLLDTCIKKEQALGLSLRGCEQRRNAALLALQLRDVTLRELPARYPQELQSEAKATADQVLEQYQIYQSAAEVARSTLECNLHQIEAILAAASAAEPAPLSGYRPASPEPPPGMKTDFRA